MAASSSQEKILTPDAPAPSSSSSSVSFLYPITGAWEQFQQWRHSLGLPYPSNVENLQKEARSTLLTNLFFDGIRADLTKAVSMTPVFQVTHSFALASQTSLPSYNFGAVFANNSVFLQGGVDHEGQVNGRCNIGWSEKSVSKAQLMLTGQPGQNMVQMEHDYQGKDYSVNVKLVNPSPVDGSGMIIGSYIQSLTKNLALGTELFASRGGADIPSAPTYLARYVSSDKSWIATAQLQQLGLFQATYWQKLNEKVEAAADFQLVAANGRREGIASIGAKYDLRMSTFRAQLDSTGKVSAMLEQRFAPAFAFTVTGEIDHFKNAAKVGVGVMIESSSFTPEEMGMQAPGYPQQPPPPGFP